MEALLSTIEDNAGQAHWNNVINVDVVQRDVNADIVLVSRDVFFVSE